MHILALSSNTSYAILIRGRLYLYLWRAILQDTSLFMATVLGPLRAAVLLTVCRSNPSLHLQRAVVIDSTNLAQVGAGVGSIAGMSFATTQTSCSFGSTIQG